MPNVLELRMKTMAFVRMGQVPYVGEWFPVTENRGQVVFPVGGKKLDKPLDIMFAVLLPNCSELVAKEIYAVRGSENATVIDLREAVDDALMRAAEAAVLSCGAQLAEAVNSEDIDFTTNLRLVEQMAEAMHDIGDADALVEELTTVPGEEINVLEEVKKLKKGNHPEYEAVEKLGKKYQSVEWQLKDALAVIETHRRTIEDLEERNAALNARLKYEGLAAFREGVLAVTDNRKKKKCGGALRCQQTS